MSVLMTLEGLITAARRARASDIHIVAGTPIRLRIDGTLKFLDENVMTPEDCEAYARSISHRYESIADIGELDLALTMQDGTRCRVNLFRQQGSVSAAIRLLNDDIPSAKDLGLPDRVLEFADLNQGIVLITGETGAGKSTTTACLLDWINHNRDKHIITLEDPVEYVFTADRCLINQREVGRDTRSFADGLHSILREDPDIILVGEMRSRDTIETALIAAETGHLVFATLHTNSAADTVDRIVDTFPKEQQPQIRMQLSTCLQGVVCQQLLPRLGGRGRVLATEVMVMNGAIRNLIREGKTPQISNAIVTAGAEGSHLMDSSLTDLYRQRKITGETAVRAAHDKEVLRKVVSR